MTGSIVTGASGKRVSKSSTRSSRNSSGRNNRMPQARKNEGAMTNETIVERTGDRELVVTRTFNAPAHIVFDAWTKPALLKRWWAPKSFGVSLFECEQDVRVGGAYRFAFGRDPKSPEVFSGRY